MNLIKIVSFIFVLFLFVANTTFAQSRATDLSEEQKEEIRNSIEEYAVALDLSEDQRPQFEEITKKYAQQMKAVKDGGGRRMDKFKKVKAIRDSKDAEMKSLLSKDQYRVYLDKREELNKRIMKRRG